MCHVFEKHLKTSGYVVIFVFYSRIGLIVGHYL